MSFMALYLAATECFQCPALTDGVTSDFEILRDSRSCLYLAITIIIRVNWLLTSLLNIIINKLVVAHILNSDIAHNA